MNRIPIVISSDNKAFFTVGVVLTSLLENAKSDTFYEINVLYTSDVTEENKNKLLELKNRYQNMSLCMFNMGDKFKDIPSTEGYHVNYVSAYKMLIPSMFLQYEKLIYLDTDIIVRGDLWELYNENLGDNYIGGCPAVSYHLDKELNNKIIKQTNLPNLDYYVNAGVLLMNLNKIREDKIDEKWISLIGKFEGSVDQTIFNTVCYGRIVLLPIKYNACLTCIKLYNTPEMRILCTEGDAEEALKQPVIFHWTGREKPWKYDDTILASEWLRYYAKSPYGSMPLERGKCNIVKNLNKYKKTWYIAGIPMLKCKIEDNKKTYYLFGFIKFLHENKRRR